MRWRTLTGAELFRTGRTRGSYLDTPHLLTGMGREGEGGRGGGRGPAEVEKVLYESPVELRLPLHSPSSNQAHSLTHCSATASVPVHFYVGFSNHSLVAILGKVHILNLYLCCPLLYGRTMVIPLSRMKHRTASPLAPSIISAKRVFTISRNKESLPFKAYVSDKGQGLGLRFRLGKPPEGSKSRLINRAVQWRSI